MSKKNKSGGLVFSTEFGRACPDCGQPLDECQCAQEEIPESDGFVRISLDRKGRKGKGMTILTGIPLPDKELKVLAKQLKQKCGVGGAVKNHTIEIQGDQRDSLESELKSKGYKTKRVGG